MTVSDTINIISFFSFVSWLNSTAFPRNKHGVHGRRFYLPASFIVTAATVGTPLPWNSRNELPRLPLSCQHKFEYLKRRFAVNGGATIKLLITSSSPPFLGLMSSGNSASLNYAAKSNNMISPSYPYN
ncbi:uncharacterized protein LOC120130171 [Hibiscus syriacus]|uniref:uncharacterized protein LOC120130171 n=1 Tax=Hibiscus syriacus TaxID=106335 RepID=UPI0019230951|nr:uncharacterized protein LOC120130171 [Hibiscus syriacus]